MDALPQLSERLAPGGVIGLAVAGRIASIKQAQARALTALLAGKAAPSAPEATLAELAQLAERLGLVVAGVLPREDYEVAAQLTDPVLRARVEALPDLARWRFAELWSGRIATHRALLSRGRASTANLRAPAGISALAALSPALVPVTA